MFKFKLKRRFTYHHLKTTRLLFLFLYWNRFLHFYFASALPLKKVSHVSPSYMALKVTSFCFFALYLPFYGIYNYVWIYENRVKDCKH